jgi:Fe-S cluster assembly protein SufD
VSTAFLEQFTAVRTDGPAWLKAVRERAMASFQSSGIPTMRNEDWHFTNPAPIAEGAFGPMQPPSGRLTADGISSWLFGEPGWPRLVFVNGRYSPSLSATDGLGSAKVMSLAVALREEPSLLERHVTRYAAFDPPGTEVGTEVGTETGTDLGTDLGSVPGAQAFSALNTALMQDGAVVLVPEGVKIATPIQLLFVSDENAAGGASHPRVLIVAEANAQVTLIEQYVAAGGTRYFTNAVTEAYLGQGATVSHFRLQQEARDAFHVGTTVAHQERDSHFLSFSFATGADLSRINVYSGLHGQGCGATLNGLYMLGGTQHCDHQTRIEHAQPDCYSRELYKGVLDDASHGVFNGKVYVHPIAQKTDGKQTNNTLLLSERARIDTKPQLEIFADDVKCTHGATVGRIDETALFYMKSRGIPNSEARKLLTYAFCAEVLETIPVDALRVGLERLAAERFTGTVA